MKRIAEVGENFRKKKKCPEIGVKEYEKMVFVDVNFVSKNISKTFLLQTGKEKKLPCILCEDISQDNAPER